MMGRKWEADNMLEEVPEQVSAVTRNEEGCQR